MKCSKCGGECKENQAFCLKCGNPIQVVPDFNLIEAELASNIGELMAEIDSEDKSGEKKVQVQKSEADEMEIKLVDISRNSNDNVKKQEIGMTKVIGNVSGLGDNAKDDDISWEKTDKEYDPLAEEVEEPKKLKEPKKSNSDKKKIIAISSAIVAILAIAIGAFVWLASSVEETATSYDDYYKMAEDAHKEGKIKDAIDNIENAKEKSDSKSARIKACEFLHKLYTEDNNTSEEYIDNLEELVSLGTENEDCYIALAKYYDENDKVEKLSAFLAAIEDEKILEKLQEFVVEAPKANFETGEYNEYFAVEFTAPEGCVVYYTVDSRNPSNYGETYIEAIPVTSEGETIIKAIAINKKGVESKVVTYTYNVELKGSGAPKVSPAAGQYEEYTKIKIEVPEGAKAYFTWDGTDPTEASEEYKEELDMPRGINILKVLIVDKYGIKSEIAKYSYNLQIPPQITINEAMSIAQEKAKETTEATDIIEASYEDIVVLENNEYYIIMVSVKDKDQKDKLMTFYAINTFDKSVEIAVDVEGKYELLKPTEEETTVNQ